VGIQEKISKNHQICILDFKYVAKKIYRGDNLSICFSYVVCSLFIARFG
jgi:hypothetical protein